MKSSIPYPLQKETDMQEDKIYFFGYGAYRDVQRISKILGHTPAFYSGAILTNFSLYYQSLNQIPLPAKKILSEAWGPEFKAYTIGSGNGIVAGVVWEITQADLELIKKWEFEGVWREIININVKTFDGKDVAAVSEKAINSSENEGPYDGLNYPNNINQEKHLVTDEETAKEDVYKIEKIKALRLELNQISGQPVNPN